MIPLFKPYMPKDISKLEEILRSGRLNYGEWGKLFENKLGEYLGNPSVLSVNSYNSAILVMINTLGIHAGDEIIASPMSCLISNQPYATQGIKIQWADIDPHTGTLEPNSVLSKINNRTKAIVHNHFCGYPGYIDEINQIGRDHGIFVIDDAIESFGSEYKRKKIGNLGADVTIYSFQNIRLPNTIDGGGISFRDEDLYNKTIRIRDLGIDRSKFRDKLSEISADYDITEAGYAATLSEPNSYIGCAQLEDIDTLIIQQRANAKIWKNMLQDQCTDIEILSKKTDNPNYWVFGLLSKNKIKSIREFRDKGYYASGVHLPNNNYSLFGKRDLLPGVDEFHSKFLAIPSGWWVNHIK